MSEHTMTIPALNDPYHGTVHWVADPGHSWLAVQADRVRASGATISRYSYVSPDGAWAYLEEDCDAGAFCEAVGYELPWASVPEHYCYNNAYVRELSAWVG